MHAKTVFNTNPVDIVQKGVLVPVDHIHISAPTDGHVWIHASFELFYASPRQMDVGPPSPDHVRVIFSIHKDGVSGTEHEFEFSRLRVSGNPDSVNVAGQHPITIQRLFKVSAGDHKFYLRAVRNEDFGGNNSVHVGVREINAIFIA